MGKSRTKRVREHGPMAEVWRRLKKNPPAIVGLVIFAIIVLLAIFADVLADKELTTKLSMSIATQAPSAEHIFGTDELGRDVFARIVHGARPSLAIGFVATLISATIGIFLGGAVGYFGGKFDVIVMRLTDVIQCIPSMLLLLTIVSVLGTDTRNLLLALTIATLPGNIRSVRAVVLNVVDAEFIQSAKSYGTSNFMIIVKHILPNAIGPIIVNVTSMVSSIILAAASMSFLGFGVQPPSPEWGVMIADSKAFMRTAPYLMIIPGLFMVLTAMSINLVGDGLRDALDPRLKD